MKERAKTSIWEIGLSWPLIIFLAALTIPRILGHDLQLTEDGSFINTVLVLIPMIAWVMVVLWKKVPNPFKALLIIGLVHGLFLAVIHQFTWETFWDGDLPRLEGSLEGQFSPTVENVLLRTVAFISSVQTGFFTGVVIGGLTWIFARVWRKPVEPLKKGKE
jgi:hypothetical protein